VAEKLEALNLKVLGLINSRLKDYFDLWLLPKLYPFGCSLLSIEGRSISLVLHVFTGETRQYIVCRFPEDRAL